MSFKYSTEPKDWQNVYTQKQGFADSMQRAGLMLIPIFILLLVPLFFAIFRLAASLEKGQSEGLGTNAILFIIIMGALLFFLAIIFTILILRHLFTTAGAFLKIFFDLPSSINISQIISLRVFGRPPLPLPLSLWFKFPTVNVKNGKLDPQENWQMQIGGPVKLNIEPGSAVYLERGTRFSRVAGQGGTFLELYETVKTVISTGPQSEDFSLTAWTREGIRVNLKARGEYFLGSATRNKGEENLLFPYDPASARSAVEQTLLSGKEGHEWIKSALGKTIGALSEYISSRYLEEIFIANNNNEQLLSTATMNDLALKINGSLQKSGVLFSHLQIIDVELPEQVNQQRIRIWETNQKTHATVTESEVKAYQLRSQKKALAEMLRDLVFTLANGMERTDSNKFTEKLLSSIYAVINQGMKDPRTYASLLSDKTPDGISPPELDFHFSGGNE